MNDEPAAAPEDGSESAVIEMGSERLEAFSDAVMAVVMTIMAFDLRAPKGATLAALRERFPGLLVYILSFAFVGIYWNNHHHLLRATRKISGAVMWSNLFLLLWLSLIPVATKWVRDFPVESFPAAAYGVVGLGAGFAYSLLVRAIIRVNGRDSTVGRAIAGDRKGYASLGLYAGGAALAFVSPWISYALYAAVSVMWFIPDRRFVPSVNE
jgi:uncharacterized membrane protein